MTTAHTAAARGEAEIFGDLAVLCTSQGYIHAIAYFCWRDTLIRYSGSSVVAKDFDHYRSQDKLIRTEISTLIGLLIQKPIDLSLPSQITLENYVVRTEVLLHELHTAMQKPWRDAWDFNTGLTLRYDPFSTVAGMREPIFYAGESAYNFQYRAFAPQRYCADELWIETNKGFRIEDASRIADALERLQPKRLLKHIGSFKHQPPDELTALPGFMFTAQDAADASGVGIDKVERFLDTFSCGPSERNLAFTAPNEFNITNAMPILKIAPGSYILLQHYSLIEAIYESPFFWMARDKDYSPTALANRGRFTECFIADQLDTIFGASRVLRNVEIYRGKTRYTEADVLVLYGDRAIVVQAKSKRLTLEARKGNDAKLKDDFTKAVKDSYSQALLCSQALTGDGFRFVLPSGAEIALSGKPKLIYPLCVVSDHYPALAFQARQFLQVTVTEIIQPPLVTDIFTFDVFSEMLNTPLQLLNYLALRARFGSKLNAANEITILGFHLAHNLWIDGEHDYVDLGNDFTVQLDIAMLARRNGIPGRKIPKGILTRFENLTVGRLLLEIETAASPELTGLGLLILQLSQQTATFLSDGIDRIVSQAKSDDKNHDISISTDGSRSGITVHCNALPENIARERLTMHCRVRKYDTKASAWYGVLLDPMTRNIRGAVAIEGVWAPDPQMDVVMKIWPKKAPVPASRSALSLQKAGRNDPCPCGSGKKYKKCCLN